MPTLQEMVAQMAPEETVPAPTVPAPGVAPRGQALLAEANLETPASAVQAIEQLARERYGEAFVDQYGDVLGFRPATFNDRLRNISEILGSLNPAAPRQLAFAGAQARAQLEESMIERAEARRKEMSNLLSFIPRALNAKMQPKTVAKLYAEQFTAITGEEPHPSIVDALIEMQNRGDTPVDEILADLENGRISVDALRQMGVDLSTFLNFVNARESRKLRERRIEESGQRAAERIGIQRRGLALRRKGLKIRERELQRSGTFIGGPSAGVTLNLPAGTTVRREE